MASNNYEATVRFADGDGRSHGSVRIVASSPDARVPIVEVDEAEAAQWGEERVQLLEGWTYEYELSGCSPGFRLRENPAVRTSQLAADRGTIRTGTDTGLLLFVLEDRDGTQAATGAVEVRSAKVDYRHQYRRMLDDIAEKSADLLFDLRSPSSMRFAPDPGSDPQIIAQRFAFLKSLITSRPFRDALARVAALPHRRTEREERTHDARRGFAPTAKALRQFAAAHPRIPVPPSHPLAKRLESVPKYLTLPAPVETLDTPENRFVKYALAGFQDFLVDMRRRLAQSNRKEDERLEREITEVENALGESLTAGIFREVGDLTFLPLSSPVLQRRAGYKEILQAWLKFSLAARVVWQGGDDVFGGGKRDLATLYEYWVFFKLLDVVAAKFQLRSHLPDRIFSITEDGFELRLRSGQHLSIKGDFEASGRKIAVRFSYNRTFPRSARTGDDPETNYPRQGSWTRAMRPDYTLSLWPAEFKPAHAEAQELMVHVHFDAKYRVERLTDLFGGDTDEDVTTEKAAEKRGATTKRADLLKMHAYRDAIRRSEGAYVLFPGTESKKWRGFREILPGIGAFAVSPGSGAGESDGGHQPDGFQEVADFIDSVIAHLCDRAARRERATYHLFRAHLDTGTPRIPVRIPEKDGDGTRNIPPTEQMVLAAWCGTTSPPATSLWSNGTFCYYVPAGSVIEVGVASARYLLLYDEVSLRPGLHRLRDAGPSLTTKGHLLQEGFPAEQIVDGVYLAFRLDPQQDPALSSWAWSAQAHAALGLAGDDPVPAVFDLASVAALKLDDE